MTSEHGDPDDLGRIPLVNTSRETGDLQDMYRRTLAASWTCRDGELPPDQLIEELFAGGSGWPATTPNTRSGGDGCDESMSIASDADSRTTVQGSRLSPNPDRRPKSSSSDHSRTDSKGVEDRLGGRGSLDNQMYDGNKERRWRNRRTNREVSEFDVRGDLRTWEISVRE